MSFLAVLIGLFLLVKGGDWLLKSAVALSLRLNIPKIVVGMTIVSFATSAPELIVSIQAALSGHPDLALGNVIGSNIANIAFVLAIIIIIAPIDVTKSFYKTDWPMLMIATAVFYGVIAFDSKLHFYEGATMVTLLVVFIVYLIKFQKPAVVDDYAEDYVLPNAKIFNSLILGGFSLWLGSEVLIKGAVTLATSLGVSERIISITVISIGTSIPELSASIIAIINREKAISLGNLIGSNIFNVLAVIPITAMIQPIHVMESTLLERDILWMIAISFIILPLVFFPRGLQLGRIDGVILLILYLLFIIPLFL